ncbi:MAG: phosphatase PAP2 family protein [Planctomycetaceae bacterium]|jgi:membrane-associated phospholipid phosphatase|nr:phosphatase PAP2 family protein [Planctomycetaceae bacterium]
MIKNILQFVFVLFFGLIFTVICNRFFDYPVSFWFCENGFNVIERPRFSGVEIRDTEQVVSVNEWRNRLSGWVLLFEFFGHPLCFLMVFFLCFFLDVRNRYRLFRFMFCVLFSQAVVTAIKLFIHRKRPDVNDFSISSFDLTGMIGGNGIHSFPSGHTALAVVLALCLASLYPRGRYLFYFAALGVAFERVFDCRHYLSDTVVGGLTAYVVWFFCYKFGFIAGKFNNIESSAGLDVLQNNCNDNSQPSILFSSTSLGTASRKRFSSGIHQFLHKDDKPINHLKTETDTKNNKDNNEKNNNEDEYKDENNKTEPSENNIQQPQKRPRQRNDLPFNKFKNL